MLKPNLLKWRTWIILYKRPSLYKKRTNTGFYLQTNLQEEKRSTRTADSKPQTLLLKSSNNSAVWRLRNASERLTAEVRATTEIRNLISLFLLRGVKLPPSSIFLAHWLGKAFHKGSRRPLTALSRGVEVKERQSVLQWYDYPAFCHSQKLNEHSCETRSGCSPTPRSPLQTSAHRNKSSGFIRCPQLSGCFVSLLEMGLFLS